MVHFKVGNAKLRELWEHCRSRFSSIFKVYIKDISLLYLDIQDSPFLALTLKRGYLLAINTSFFKSMPRLGTSEECRGSQESPLLNSLPYRVLCGSFFFFLWLVSTLPLSFIESRGWQYFPVTSTFTPKLVFIGSHCVHYKATCLVGSSKWELQVFLFFTALFWLTSNLPPKAESVEETTSKR